MTDNLVPLLTSLTEIEIPKFTYYSWGAKNKSNLMTATISTSQKVRLFDDTDSSPMTVSMNARQSPDVVSVESTA